MGKERTSRRLGHNVQRKQYGEIRESYTFTKSQKGKKSVETGKLYRQVKSNYKGQLDPSPRHKPRPYGAFTTKKIIRYYSPPSGTTTKQRNDCYN